MVDYSFVEVRNFLATVGDNVFSLEMNGREFYVRTRYAMVASGDVSGDGKVTWNLKSLTEDQCEAIGCVVASICRDALKGV